MKFASLPLDLLCEILIFLTTIERKKISRISIVLNKAIRNARPVSVEWKVFKIIARRNPNVIFNLNTVQKIIFNRSFKSLQYLQCHGEFAYSILKDNAKQNYFDCIQSLDILNSKTKFSIAKLLKFIVGTKLQHTLQKLSVRRMDFYIIDTNEMNKFYYNMAALSNINSLTFDYAYCEFRTNDELCTGMINYFLFHLDTRPKTKEEMLGEHDPYYEISYTVQEQNWTKFINVFEKARASLVNIESIKILNIEIDEELFIIFSICLHSNLKHLHLNIRMTERSFDFSKYSLFQYMDAHFNEPLSFYKIEHFIPVSLSLQSLTLNLWEWDVYNSYAYMNRINYGFVYLINALHQIIVASKSLVSLNMYSWSRLLKYFDCGYGVGLIETKEDDEIYLQFSFDLNIVIGNYCISNLVFRSSFMQSAVHDGNIKDLNVWKPLLWFYRIINNEAKHNKRIEIWLRNTLKYFEFYIKMTAYCSTFHKKYGNWNDYWNDNLKQPHQQFISSLPKAINVIAMKCSQFDIKCKISIDFCPWRSIQSHNKDKLNSHINLWREFLGKNYTKFAPI